MKQIKKAIQFYRTVLPLKWEQVFYRIAYTLSAEKNLKKLRANHKEIYQLPVKTISLSQPVLQENNGVFHVSLLNKNRTYHTHINWNDQRFGRLWNYHLQYAEFLLQENIDDSIKSELLSQIYDQLYKGALKPECYPASLRSMNVIKWLSGIPSSQAHTYETILNGLYSELDFIFRKPEYHLLGNHLLENAFGLLMGGFFLNQEKWIQKAEQILNSELEEQILPDGAHFERSVMYHQTILQRMLEAISYLPPENSIAIKLRQLASSMLGWLHLMKFKNGDLANFNDATIACSKLTPSLLELVDKLGIKPTNNLKLSDSGFRKREWDNIEMIIKTGGVEPAYQPAHNHADTFSFILHANQKSVIADPGISTYDPGVQRQKERSTSSHNTVTAGNLNTADIWEVFRIGQRPDVKLVEENPHSLSMQLEFKPFRSRAFRHQRTIDFENQVVIISDSADGTETATGRLHLHPDIEKLILNDNKDDIGNKRITVILQEAKLQIHFYNCENVDFFEYDYNEDFNRPIRAKGIFYQFKNQCSLTIDHSPS